MREIILNLCVIVICAIIIGKMISLALSPVLEYYIGNMDKVAEAIIDPSHPLHHYCAHRVFKALLWSLSNKDKRKFLRTIMQEDPTDNPVKIQALPATKIMTEEEFAETVMAIQSNPSEESPEKGKVKDQLVETLRGYYIIKK